MLYANYIRNKMHHLLKSIFASGYPLKIISKFKKKAVNYTIHGKTEIGKNLIPYPYMYTTRTVNGVTYTDNGDGSVTVSGTATGYSDFFFKIMSIAPNTTFTFSKNQSDDAANVAFTLRQLDENRALVGTEISLIPTVATHTFTTAENARYIQIACKRYGNVECKGTYKPMLELGDTATEYEKYTVYGVGDKTKNLIPYPYANTTKTVNGVTFTDNGDGSITVNGTATANATFYIKTTDKNFKPSSTTLYISGCPAGGSLSTYRMTVSAFKQTESDYTYVVGASDIGNGALLNLTNKDYSQLELSINIFSGTTVNNLVFKPMLEIGNTATDYEPYGYKIPLVNTGKNLIPYPYINTTQTVNGITFTDNGDGSITVNGTATAEIVYMLSMKSNGIVGSGTYFLTGCPSGGSATTYMIQNQVDGVWTNPNYDIGEGKIINVQSSITQIAIVIKTNTTVNNLVFKPMLEIGNTATDYEPYRAPDTTNVYHTAPLKDGESISYKADSLPELQLYKGENNITADTAVAPSAIDIKYLN